MKENDLSDNELLEMYRNTINQSFLIQLYKRYDGLTYGVCLKYLKDKQKADDAYQEIYIKLQNYRNKIDNFKWFLYATTCRHCVDVLRKQKKYLNLKEIEIPNGADEYAMKKKLEDCIQRLQNQEKECIEIYYYGEKKISYNDLAEKTRFTEEQVKQFLDNARRHLRRCVNNDY